MEVRVARGPDHCRDAARLLFGYQRERTVEGGKAPPDRPEDVWAPVRHEVLDPASAFTTYLVAHRGGERLGGVGLVAHDALSVLLTRCYVRPAARRRGVAAALVAVAADEGARRGVARLALDILASREAAITAWRRLGFVDCEPWGDRAMRYFERPVADGGPPPWLGLRRDELVLHDHDERWSMVFQHHAEAVRRGPGGQVGEVEHVGSTAVEGLVAKPVVDLAVQLAPAADEAKVIASLEARRYVFRGDKNDHGAFCSSPRTSPTVAPSTCTCSATMIPSGSGTCGCETSSAPTKVLDAATPPSSGSWRAGTLRTGAPTPRPRDHHRSASHGAPVTPSSTRGLHTRAHRSAAPKDGTRCATVAPIGASGSETPRRPP